MILVLLYYPRATALQLDIGMGRKGMNFDDGRLLLLLYNYGTTSIPELLILAIQL
jgi:hypothetical protein